MRRLALLAGVMLMAPVATLAFQFSGVDGIGGMGGVAGPRALRDARHLRRSHHLRMEHHPPHAQCDWQSLSDSGVANQVLARYFGPIPMPSNTSNAPVNQTPVNQTVEFFCIGGVPAAAIVFRARNSHGDPVVDSVLLNLGLLLMFDAAAQMRRSLFSRYRNIDLRAAKNRDLFFLSE